MSTATKPTAGEAGDALGSAASSIPLIWLARLGRCALGAVHLLIAWLALQIAWSSTDRPGGAGDEQSGDKSGALATVAANPLGRTALWIVVVGLFALALWQLTEGLWGVRHKSGSGKVRARLLAVVKAVLFVVLAISAIGFARGHGSADATIQQDQTAGVLSLAWGQFAVVVAGLVVIGVGVAHVVKGVRRKFVEHIDKAMPAGMRSLITKLGVFGYVSEGIAFTVVGGLLAYASLTFDPQKSRGLDGALRLIVTAPLGWVLLAVIGLGFFAFGLFQFARARYETLSVATG